MQVSEQGGLSLVVSSYCADDACTEWGTAAHDVGVGRFTRSRVKEGLAREESASRSLQEGKVGYF